MDPAFAAFAFAAPKAGAAASGCLAGAAAAAPTAFYHWPNLGELTSWWHWHWPSGDRFAAGLKNVVGAERALYQWAHDGVVGPTKAIRGQGQMIEYLHAGAPNAKQMNAAWWQAVRKWLSQSSDIAARVAWQQKQCFDSMGRPGRDFQDCQQQNIVSQLDARQFPVVRYFPAGSLVGQEFTGERTPENFVQFAEGMGKLDSQERAADTAGEDMGYQMTEYYAAACPHCTRMKPAWDTAASEWSKVGEETKAPLVKWEAKECFDDQWRPGKDFQECLKEDVESVPALKLKRYGPDGSEQSAHEYTGPRTAEGFVNFVKEEMGIPASASPSSAPTSGGSAQGSASAASEGEAHGSPDAAGEPSGGNAEPLDEQALIDESMRRDLAKGGYDHLFVNYYSSAGARSKRLSGVFENASRKWVDITDPEADAMFLAQLKKADALRGIDYGPDHTDLPFIWFQQKECYDSEWRPGHDYAECKRHGIKTFPTARLYNVATPEGDFIKSGVDFHGPRTVKGLLQFLGKETDLEKLIENKHRFEESILGVNAPAKMANPLAEPATPVAGSEQSMEPGTNASDVLKYFGDGVRSLFGASADQPATSPTLARPELPATEAATADVAVDTERPAFKTGVVAAPVVTAAASLGGAHAGAAEPSGDAALRDFGHDGAAMLQNEKTAAMPLLSFAIPPPGRRSQKSLPRRCPTTRAASAFL